MTSTLTLQQEWQQLMRQLPAAAIARDPAQPIWPVRADHCFGRIILDNIIGIDRPWRERLAAPAIRNMDTQQLEECIRMARDILSGKADLVALNQNSLKVRGKENKRDLRVPSRVTRNVKAEESPKPSSARKRYTQTTLSSLIKSGETEGRISLKDRTRKVSG